MKIRINIDWNSKDGEKNTWEEFAGLGAAEEWLTMNGNDAQGEENELELKEAIQENE